MPGPVGTAEPGRITIWIVVLGINNKNSDHLILIFIITVVGLRV